MKNFYLTHLYPEEMTIYGDRGNILTLNYRLQELGFEVILQFVGIGDDLPTKTDFYLIGGGADKDQYEVYRDLLSKKTKLIHDVEKGVALLAICGGYQLLGEKFVGGDGREVEGIGLFPIETKALGADVKSRCIGNIVQDCLIEDLEGVKLVGFENHGGQTYLQKDFDENDKFGYLGKVVLGYGNNFEEGYEGCVYKNAIGTYLHGPILPKNPELADYLIYKTLRSRENRDGEKFLSGVDFDIIDDSISRELKKQLVNRFVK